MKHFATAMLAFVAMLVALPAARAADTVCPPSPIFNSTINGNLVVPANMTCALFFVTVTGNVQVGTGASLFLQGATIDGNLRADQCNQVALIIRGFGPTRVGGNARIENCTLFGAAGAPIIIDGNLACNGNGRCIVEVGSVGGNAQINGNGGVTLGSTTFGGNVQVDDNTGASIVGGNTIGGNLSCQGNTPPPIDQGDPNTVAGKKQGQCAGL